MFVLQFHSISWDRDKNSAPKLWAYTFLYSCKIMCSILSEKPFLKILSCILLILLNTAHWACSLKNLPEMTPRYFSQLLDVILNSESWGTAQITLPQCSALDFFYIRFHLTYYFSAQFRHLPSELWSSFSYLAMTSDHTEQPHITLRLGGFTADFFPPVPWWKCLIKLVSVSIPQGPHCWK